MPGKQNPLKNVSYYAVFTNFVELCNNDIPINIYNVIYKSVNLAVCESELVSAVYYRCDCYQLLFKVLSTLLHFDQKQRNSDI